MGDNSNINDQFERACSEGHLDVAKSLIVGHDLMFLGKGRGSDNVYFNSLRYACSGGYFDIVKWLVEMFRLDDFSSGKITKKEIVRAIEHACGCGNPDTENNRFEIVEFLIEKFKIISEDIKENDKYFIFASNLFTITCQWGQNFKIARYISYKFNMGYEYTKKTIIMLLDISVNMVI